MLVRPRILFCFTCEVPEQIWGGGSPRRHTMFNAGKEEDRKGGEGKVDLDDKGTGCGG